MLFHFVRSTMPNGVIQLMTSCDQNWEKKREKEREKEWYLKEVGNNSDFGTNGQ